MKVFLIGMPGSGKSTLGLQVAEKLQYSFVDLDNEIERSEATLIPEIFRIEGEAYFRESESIQLKEYTRLNSNFVMATGGGAPCFFDNMEFMNKNGTTIFLNPPVSEIALRLKEEQADQRPLIKNKTGQELIDFLTRMLERRSTFYCSAHLTLEDEIHADNLIKLLEAHSDS